MYPIHGLTTKVDATNAKLGILTVEAAGPTKREVREVLSTHAIKATRQSTVIPKNLLDLTHTRTRVLTRLASIGADAAPAIRVEGGYTYAARVRSIPIYA